MSYVECETSNVNFQTDGNAENLFFTYLRHFWKYFDTTNAIFVDVIAVLMFCNCFFIS